MTESNARQRAILEEVAARFGGQLPNVYRMLARHPAALAAFVGMESALRDQGHLSDGEQALVGLEVAVANGCRYCQGAFELEARTSGIDETTVNRVSARELPGDPRHKALIEATRRVMAAHGHLGGAEQALLADRGVTEATLLEITTLVAAYTLATYTNNLTGTRIDPEFR